MVVDTNRNRGLGASDVAAALGLNPHTSRMKLWGVKTGRLPEFEGNTASRLGNHLEQFVLDEWCKANGKIVISQQRVIEWCDDPVMWATLDAEVADDEFSTPEVIEAKTTTSDNPEIGDGPDGFPYHWRIQARCQAVAARVPYVRIVCLLVDTKEWREFIVRPDEETFPEIIEGCREFWHYVKNDIVPPAEWSAKGRESERFGWIAPSVERVDLDPAMCAVWREYEELGRQSGDLEKQRDALKATVLRACGDGTLFLMDDDRELVISNSERKGFTVAPTTVVNIRARKVKRGKV